MGNFLRGISGYVDVLWLLLSGAMVSLILFLASFGPASTGYYLPAQGPAHHSDPPSPPVDPRFEIKPRHTGKETAEPGVRE